MKKVLIWVAAVILTLTAAIYQRMTGPTYPLRLQTEVNNSEFNFKLTRSASIGEGCTVIVPVNEHITNVKLVYRKYPGKFTYDTIPMQKDNQYWYAALPTQPPAGKLEYFVVFYDSNKQAFYNNKDKTAIVRFKGDVPSAALIPHVIAMFFAMLFSTAAALMALFNVGNFRRVSFIAFGLLTLGGLIFGPIVQHFAFGEAWTGWPVGKDLTDNKTLITAVFWLGAVILNWKKPRRWAVIVAAVVLLAVYSIPHSARGSEYNYETEEVTTG